MLAYDSSGYSQVAHRFFLYLHPPIMLAYDKGVIFCVQFYFLSYTLLLFIDLLPIGIPMSEYTFSHQFSQRWLAAPQKVRDAIVHELEDIITLLDSQTELDSFEFRQPYLAAHINKMYAEAKQQKASEQHNQQDGQPSEQPSHLPKTPQSDIDEQVVEAINVNTDDAVDLQQDSLPVENTDEPSDKQITGATNTVQDEGVGSDVVHNEEQNININQNKQASVKAPIIETAITPETSEIEAIHSEPNEAISDENLPIVPPQIHEQENEAESLIVELESRIDDYLSEQMAQLSEDLKSWLRSEVKRHLDK